MPPVEDDTFDSSPNGGAGCQPPTPQPRQANSDLRSREGLPPEAAVIVAGQTTVPLLQSPGGVWGLQIIAVDTMGGAKLVLFAALPLEREPDPFAHEGDVVVRLLADPDVPAEHRAVVDVEILVARQGLWGRVGVWVGLNQNWPHQLCGPITRLMDCDSRPVSEPSAMSVVADRAGALAPIVSAGLLADGEALLCVRPAECVRYEGKVIDGGIQLPDGRWFGAPSGALTALGFPHQNGWRYWVRARDGVPLSQLRITKPILATAVGDPGRARVRFKDLLADGTVCPGDEFRFERPYLGVVHTARALPDGQVQLADGRCYGTPAAAIAAVSNGKVTDGWRTWRRVQDGRTLDELRQDHLSRGTTLPLTSPDR